MNVQLSIPGAGPTAASSKLLTALADAAASAIDTAATTTEGTANIAREAATEFTKGLSKETAEKLVDGFADLIEGGFKPSKDKVKDGQLIAQRILIDILESSPVGPRQAPLFPRLKEKVLFGLNQSRLTPSANKIIGRVRDFAVANPGTIILLTGNADTLGPELKNLNLAHSRTMAVRQRLVSAGGITASRVFTTDLGNSGLPVVTSGNFAEPRNRCVTIEVR